MAPSTRASAGISGKDAEQKIQQQLDTDGNVKSPKATTAPRKNTKAGTKRDAPIEIDTTDDNKRQKPNQGQPAANDPALKQEAAVKQGLADADEIDQKAEAAKAKGAEMMEVGMAKELSHGTLESGHIYIWYKPKVETEDPQNLDDVAKCHILLMPKTSDTTENDTKYRFITCGRKHLPAARESGNREREWGTVASVGDNLNDLTGILGSSTYETKSRGTRHQPASRCAGYGHYVLHSPTSGDGVKPKKKRASDMRPREHPVYLAYSVAVPAKEDFGEVQKELEIQPQGSILISVKNPDAPSSNPAAPRKRDDQKEQYPPELRAHFTTRWIPANPVELLDYPGQELLLISGRETLPDGAEDEAAKPAEKHRRDLDKKKKDSSDTEAIFKEVFAGLAAFREQKASIRIKALEGQWT